jgi:hypothetical protein
MQDIANNDNKEENTTKSNEEVNNVHSKSNGNGGESQTKQDEAKDDPNINKPIEKPKLGENAEGLYIIIYYY